MTTQVDFYILPDTTNNGRLLLACRLAEKAFNAGNHVYIHAKDVAQAEYVDNLLWTFKQSSFIPHARYPAAPDDVSPVLVGNDTEPQIEAEVLMNLAEDVPTFYARFKRVIELVDQDRQVLNVSRQRYRFYRDQGLEPNSHKL